MSHASPSRRAAVAIIERLRGAGHTAYLAGGCVRDALLGIEPKDYDVATDAEPDAVRRLFPGSRYVGEAFGVVLVAQRSASIEVATFRLEWGYADGRRPDKVEFTDAEHDARRRDFTINGLFADPRDGGDEIIDYVGGRADLEARLIRAIGDPDQRFGEDYLRMLRAVRFAARLGFEVEAKTAAAIRPLAKYLGQISRERIGQEVLAMLTGPDPVRAVRLMQALKLDSPTLNEDPAEPEPAVLARLTPPIDAPTALAAWMLDRRGGSSSLTAAAGLSLDMVLRRWRRALSLSNDVRDALHGQLRLLGAIRDWDELGVAQRKRTLASPWWAGAWTLARAVEPGVGRIGADVAALEADGVAPPPLVNGDDLIAMGLEPGPRFKQLLDGAYDAQLEHVIDDRDAALAWLRNAAEMTR